MRNENNLVISKGKKRRAVCWRVCLLLTVLCVLLMAAPAMAKGKKKANKKRAALRAAYLEKEREILAAEWMGGTWEGTCYINEQGNIMADLKQENQEPLIRMKGLGKKSILYIGASHTERTKHAVKDPDVFFYGSPSACFRWFFYPRMYLGKRVLPAYQVIRAFLKARPAGTVIIDMGGNDFKNVDIYIGFYRELLRRYPRATFYFKVCMPRELGNSTNGDRMEFNKKLAAEFPEQTIDLFERIYSLPNFMTIDGVHYAKRLYRRIYQMTMDEIGRKVVVNVANGKVAVKQKRGAGKAGSNTAEAEEE